MGLLACPTFALQSEDVRLESEPVSKVRARAHAALPRSGRAYRGSRCPPGYRSWMRTRKQHGSAPRSLAGRGIHRAGQFDRDDRAGAARVSPQCWIAGDISEWAACSDGQFDVVFSNAALQWVDDHAAVYPRLLSRVAPGGALAIQIPGNIDALPHRLMRELAATPEWSRRFPPGKVREWHHREMEFYYDVLASAATRLDLWVTEYLHI